MPAFNKIYEKYHNNTGNFIMLGIDGDAKENDAKVKQWVQKESMKYPMISGVEGKGGAIMKSFNNTHYPTIHFVGPDKTILEKEIEGKSSPQKLEALIAKHVSPTGIRNTTERMRSAPVEILGCTHGSITVSIHRHDAYIFSFFTMQGKRIHMATHTMDKGTHAVAFSKTTMHNGAFIVQIKSHDYNKQQKIVF